MAHVLLHDTWRGAKVKQVNLNGPCIVWLEHLTPMHTSVHTKCNGLPYVDDVRGRGSRPWQGCSLALSSRLRNASLQTSQLNSRQPTQPPAL